MNTFFASQNTCGGFVSRFESIFYEDRLDRLYIIKGGPGTGKNRLLRMIADKWNDDPGLEVFLCSSDPDSLDGVLSPKRGAAVIDGTAPHAADTRYPGAVSRFIDLGAFWDERTLRSNRSLITELSKKKSLRYSRAYALLRAAGTLRDGIKGLALEGIDREKMKKAAQRLAAAIHPSPDPESAVRLISTFNRFGRMRLDSFEELSDKRVLVCDRLFTGDLFLEELLRLTQESRTVIAYSPADGRPEGLFCPESGVCVMRSDRDDWESRLGVADKYVNMDRFIDPRVKKENRQKIRFWKRCADSLTDAASREFEAAGEIHARLEEIYGSAMDFRALTQFQESVVESL